VVREDAHTLYGFVTVDERSAFPPADPHLGHRRAHGRRVALGASVGELTQAVALQDAARLTKIRDRQKTAERLLLELKGKLGALGAAPVWKKPRTFSTRSSPSATAKKRRTPQRRACRPVYRGRGGNPRALKSLAKS